MAEIIYLKDVLFIRPKSNEKDKKSASRLKPMKTGKILKASLIERKKEDIKTN